MKDRSSFKAMPLTARAGIMMFAIMGFASVVYVVVHDMRFAPGHLGLLMAAATACAKAKVKLYKASTISLLTSVVLLAIVMDGLASALIVARSEEHTSELQSPCNLVCRLLLEKKKHRLRIRKT